MVILETKRLILRHWKVEDKAVFAEMNSDPEVMRYFPNVMNERESNDMADRISELIDKQGYGLYAVEEKDGGSFIGFIGFAHPSFEASFTPCVEIGWRLHNKAWGRGYATEGAKACLAYGFRTLGFNTITSFTSEINRPSINVMKKIGLKYDLNFSHPKIDRDHELCEHVMYQLTKEAWENNNGN